MLASKQVSKGTGYRRVKVISSLGTGSGQGAGTVPEGELSPARLRISVARMARWLRPTAAAGPLTTTEIDMLVVAEKHGPCSHV